MPLFPDMNIKMLGYWSRLVFTMGFVFMNFFLMFCSSRSSSRGSTTRSHALPQSSSLVKSYRTESQESVNSDKTGANDDDKRPRGICINHLPIRSTGLWSVHFSVFFAVLISWRIIPNAKTAKKNYSIDLKDFAWTFSLLILSCMQIQVWGMVCFMNTRSTEKSMLS